MGTGAIEWKHAQAYRNIGFTVAVSTNRNVETGRRFAEQIGATFVNTFEEVCSDARVDVVNVCTFPEFRLLVVQACARHGKHVQVQNSTGQIVK